jgi:N-acetylglucosaminyldiphosphoundecaprenol N-acetyl-beta-D-mannosaminyltransferase
MTNQSQDLLPRQDLPAPLPNYHHHGGSSVSTSLFAHAYADVLGVKLSAINLHRAVDMADQWIAAANCGYICVTGVHGVMEAQSDPELRRILNHAFINTPDGMPMSWVGHLQGHKQMDRVYGPDFMTAMCRLSVDRGYRHFLYGGEPGVAKSLKDMLQKRFPGLQVVGTYTPPFRSLSPEEEEEFLTQVQKAKPHMMWVGLSTPKQERFMARYIDRLQVPLLVGVGAAFNYHTGRLRESPEWVKRSGLQWLHRLMQDPKRLWKRYLRHNPAFIWNIALQMLNIRHYPHASEAAASEAQR